MIYENHTHAGTEVFQSYCPLSWDYEERQEHCKDVYGFQCVCQRCQMEGAGGVGEPMRDDGSGSDGEWMTDDDGDNAAVGEGMVDDEASAVVASNSGGGEEGGGMAVEAVGTSASAGDNEAGPLDPTYLQLFLLKYVCPVPSCFGTMAPVGPGVSLYECAVCGRTRSEEQFLADLDVPMAA